VRFVGVVHLLPLPGSPRGGSWHAVLDRAVTDARALRDGGADAAVVENLGDAPYTAGAVDPWTVAAMTAIAGAVRAAAPELELGINVLRNDALAALAVAAAVGARFIRVNVHTGAMVTDQGLIEGRARETLQERNRIGCDVRIVADVLVKHAVPLGQPDIADVARDTHLRGLADVLVVTGSGTGRPHDPQRVRAVRQAVPGCPVWVGSGVTPETARTLEADGAIVGTWLHHDGALDQPVDVNRVRVMAEALRFRQRTG
jgi:membrane complex biogenesis BtpA family protein